MEGQSHCRTSQLSCMSVSALVMQEQDLICLLHKRLWGSSRCSNIILKEFKKEKIQFLPFSVIKEGSEESYFSTSNKAKIPGLLATDSYQFTWTFSG